MSRSSSTFTVVRPTADEGNMSRLLLPLGSGLEDPTEPAVLGLIGRSVHR